MIDSYKMGKVKDKANDIKNKLKKYTPYKNMLGDTYIELESMIEEFKRDAKATEDNQRLLRIGIIGQVKAGKSTFLNSLLFSGDEILPKAATPMTAALTVIRYAPEVKAEIEFFEEKDWKRIEYGAKQYIKYYNEAKERLTKNSAEGGGLFGLQETNNLKEPTEQEILAEAQIPEEIEASYELVKMSEKNGIELSKYLGKTIPIDGIKNLQDLMGELNDYIGASGYFTPIVQNTTIYCDLPVLKGIEIVDTPGINDPIISRGRRTKKHLGQCDVVFLLSYCGQFIDKVDIELVVQNLPAKGIKNIVLVGSQLDSVMLQEYRKYNNITHLLDNLEYKLEKYAERTFEKLKLNTMNSREKRILNELESSLPPIFISAMAYNIAKHYDILNNEEKNFLDKYNRMYDGFIFNPETLVDLSSMDVVFEKLEAKKEKKEEIIEEKLGELVNGIEIGYVNNIKKSSEKIRKYIERLQSEDIQNLTEKFKKVKSQLNSGKKNIEHSFDDSILNIRKQLSMLLSDLKGLKLQFSKIDIQSESRTESHEVSTSKWYNPFTWGSTETQYYTVSTKYANVHDAIDKVEQYVYDCEVKLKERIMDIIDVQELRGKIQNATLSLFDVGDEAFDINDVIIPVERAVSKITVPEIDFGNKNYSKKIVSKFNKGRVEDNKISQLRNTQREVLNDVFSDLQLEVKSKISEIVNKLEETRNNYVDTVLKDIKDDLERFESELQNKTISLERYNDLLKLLEEDL